MIIRPQYVDKDIREYKYLSSKHDNTRFDHLYVDNKKIVKSTYFGKNKIFRDFVQTETDLKTGKVLKILSSIKGQRGSWIDRFPPNYVTPNLSGSVSNSAKVWDNSYFQTQMNLYEDEFNLSFTESVGPLLALLSGSTIAVPFRMAIIMDSKLGIMIKDFYDTFKYIDSADTSKIVLIEFMKSLNIIDKRFRDICENVKRKLRILAYIGDFGTTVRVVDTEYEMTSIYELNNSDHCRILRSVDAYTGSKYTSSEPFGILFDTKCLTLIPTLFDNPIEQENFLYRLDGENYETSYY